MQTEIIIDKVMSAGLSVLEHQNNGDFGNGVTPARIKNQNALLLQTHLAGNRDAWTNHLHHVSVMETVRGRTTQLFRCDDVRKALEDVS